MPVDELSIIAQSENVPPKFVAAVKAAGMSGVRPLMAWRQGLLRPPDASLAELMTELHNQDATIDPASGEDAQEAYNLLSACRIALPALEKAAGQAFALAAAPVADSDTTRMDTLYASFANEVKFLVGAPHRVCTTSSRFSSS